MGFGTIGLVALLAVAAGDGQKRFGDWKVTFAGPFQMAETVNEAGASIGILCSTEENHCEAFIHTRNACDEGAEVPMMLSSPGGASSVETTCRHLEIGEKSLVLNVIKPFGALLAAFEDGGKVAVAIPMKTGEFRVLRFSTAGAERALEVARTSSDTGEDTRPASEYR